MGLGLSHFIVILFLWGPLSLQAGGYIEPDLTQRLFDVKEVTLQTSEMDIVASTLAAQARQMDAAKPGEAEKMGKLLGIALRLQPENRSAVVANAQLKQGVTPKPELEFKPESGAKFLLLTGERLAKGSKEADKVLGGYLVELAAIVDPANEDILFAAEMAKKQRPVDWSWVAGVRSVPVPVAGPTTPGVPAPTVAVPAAPGPPPAMLKKTQTKINGLVVLTSDDRKLGGKRMEILATLNPNPEVQTTVYAVTEVASDMRISLDEAARAARQYRPSIEKGGQISISFDDKYSKKAGGSAGTAFAVAIISLMESFDLDPTFAITGDITVDGKMRKIGGVAQKITGGSKDGCKIIGLPAENVADVDDLPLLYPIETLQKVQVFSLTTLDDAVQLARAERTGKVQEAIKRFSDLQARWDNPSAPLSWRAPESQQELEAILALQPNHQSARILLATARGRSKRTLSMNTALDEMFAAATSLLQFYERPSQRSSEIYYMHLSKEEYKYARNRMNELEPMMPKEVSDLFYALRNLNDAIEYCDNELGQVPLWVTLPRYRQLVSKSISRVAVDDLEQRAKTMRDQMIKFNLDPAIRERLLHD